MTDRDLSDWIGRTHRARDTLTAVQGARLAALLDRPAPPGPGTPVPGPWSWVLFAPALRRSESGRDGHPAASVLNPPTGKDRRMWARSEVTVDQPLTVGEPAERVTTLRAIDWKDGRSGRLCFVRLEHEITGERGARLRDLQTIVYRDNDPGAPPPQPPAPGIAPGGAVLAVAPDEVMLFQYSAVSGNPHRIHYDQPYATRVEGYPGLVVHGPLIGTFLTEWLDRHAGGRLPAQVTVTARHPVFLPGGFEVRGHVADDDRFRTEAVDGDGALCMTAEGRLAPA